MMQAVIPTLWEGQTNSIGKPRLRRLCKCGKMFYPDGRFSKMCKKCLKTARSKKIVHQKESWRKRHPKEKWHERTHIKHI